MRLLLMLIIAVATRCMNGQTSANAPGKVIVCLQRVHDIRANHAALIASKLFAGIGIETEWHTHGCAPAPGVIDVTFSFETPASEHPGALGYTTPFEGSHIVVFFDRIQATLVSIYTKPVQDLPLAISRVLAHVLTHEIGHLLERLASHSKEGIMKAKWSYNDFHKMVYQTLRFTPEDAEKIQAGRESLLSAALTVSR